MARYLGALYKFDAFDEKKPKAPRSMLTSMDDYAANAVQRGGCELVQRIFGMIQFHSAVGCNIPHETLSHSFVTPLSLNNNSARTAAPNACLARYASAKGLLPQLPHS